MEERRARAIAVQKAIIARQKASLAKVKRRLNDISGGQTLSLFKIDAKSDYYQTIFDYVRALGGTVVTGGNPQFKLIIDVDRNYSHSNTVNYYTGKGKHHSSKSVSVYKHTIKSTIVSVKGIDGGSTVLFYKSSYVKCSSDCTDLINEKINYLLYSF